jgi:hypothetical protein
MCKFFRQKENNTGKNTDLHKEVKNKGIPRWQLEGGSRK